MLRKPRPLGFSYQSSLRFRSDHPLVRVTLKKGRLIYAEVVWSVNIPC